MPDHRIVEARELGENALTQVQEQNSHSIQSPKICTFTSLNKKAASKQKTTLHILQEESAVTRALCSVESLDPEADV